MEDLSNLFAIFATVIAGLLIAANCAHDIRRLVSARNVFILSMAAWYLVEAIIVPDEIKKYSQEQYNVGILRIILCLGAFLIAYQSSTNARVFDGLFRRLAAVDRPQILWRVFLGAAAIGFLPLLVIAGGNVLLILEDAFVPRSRWSSIFQRGRYGGARDAFLELQMFLRAAIPLAAAIAMSKRFDQGRKTVAAAFLIYVFARAFNSGTRSQVIEVFLPIAGAVYWRMPVHQKKLAIRFGLPSLAVLMMIWSAATVASRNEGGFDLQKAQEAKYVGFEMFRELLFIASVVPSESDYKMGMTYYVQAVNPIPRFLWPGKPDGDAGLELARLQGSTIEGVAYLTTSPGLIGEMYWNFGVFGILGISGFLGYLARAWDRALPFAERSLIAFTVYGAGLAIIFLSGRSFNMATLYGMLALIAVLIFFSGQKKGS